MRNHMMLRASPAFILAAVALGLTGCAQQPLPVVELVDVQRYLGKWYEIARYPNSFERGCVAATAEYTLREDGRVQVVNRCRKGTVDGPVDSVTGTARIVDPATNAKLKVTFFWPFSGDYWIIDLDPDYQYAVVGEPRRKYLWILARTPRIDEAAYNAITARLVEKGYDPAKLERPPQ